MAEKLTAKQIEEGLSNFTGTDQYHKHSLSQLIYTDGVLWLADNAGAHWLLDIIASYQPTCRKDKMLREMQFWTLKVNLKNHSAVVSCDRDEGDTVITQKVEFTDFPLAEISLWVENNVILLPSEH